jgi:SAM-dependent methyltransferase
MKWILKEYKPEHKDNRMMNEGDVVKARENYYRYKPNNLYFLLGKRFSWMNRYIKKGDRVLEVGCGTGVSKDFIRKDCKLLLTDFAEHPWIEKKVDALNTPFADNSFDVIFCSNMIHHVPFPKKFLMEMSRILKPKGYLLIQEINCSIMTQFILKLMRHEGWSYNADVYNMDIPSTDEKDLWSANCAIPNLLFDSVKGFQANVPFFSIRKQEFSEFFVMFLSGGVIAKSKTINFPFFFLKLIDKIDNLLISFFPDIFPFQRRIVLKNLKSLKR